MNNRSEKTLALTLIALVCLSFAAVLPVAAITYPNGYFYFKPTDYIYDTDDKAVNDEFRTYIYAQNLTDLYTWQVMISFNATLLSLEDWDFMPNEPVHQGTHTVVEDIDNTAGTGMLGVVSWETYGNDTIPETGMLYIDFKIIYPPPKLGYVECDLEMVTTGTKKCKWEDYGATVFVPTVTDGYYKYIWAEPPYPWLKAHPSLVEKGVMGAPAIGEEFDVDVRLEDLSADWQVTKVAFDLTYDNSFLEVLSITEGSGAGEFYDSGAYAYTIHTATAGPPVSFNGTIDSGYPPYPGGGIDGVLVATIRFNVTDQPTSPAPDYQCDLLLENIVVRDENDVDIPTEDAEDGEVIVHAFITLPLHYLEVVPNLTTLGPEYVVGTHFDVDIWIRNCNQWWYQIGAEFRLGYDPEWIQPVGVAVEGPFFENFVNYTAGEQGTWFISFPEINTQWGHHIIAGMIILPDTGGQWHDPFPEGDGVIATITFEVVKQIYPETHCSDLDFLKVTTLDKYGVYLPVGNSINGSVCITGEGLPERIIDLYTCSYPDSFNGRGPNNPSDMFWPQKEVCLCAEVTYNTWPVQSKLVDFVVYDPQMNLWTVLQAETGEYGVACTSFRIPWPCENPEELIGTWTIIADVDVACEVITDTMQFHFDYLVNIISVETDKWQYAHCEDVEITVTINSHSQQDRHVVIWVTLMDELLVPFGLARIDIDIGGAVFCTAKEYSDTVSIHVLKWAFAGEATIIVNSRFYWGGEWTAAGPEATANIFILPV